MRPRTLPLALLLAALPLAAKDPELPSAWRAESVTVDGDDAEWAGRLLPLPEQPVALGVRNDGAFLYLCLRTSDEKVKQKILGLGLTFWLDASGREARAFGVRYPAGPRGQADLDVPDTATDRERRELETAAAGGDIRFVGTRDEGTRLSTSAARPVEAALGEHGGTLVLELKVPLAFAVDAPHAIETAPGRTISLGLETSEPKSSAPRGGGSGFHLGGGHGGRGGGRSGGGRGGGRSDGEARSEEKAYGKPMKVWLTVPLARAPAATPG